MLTDTQIENLTGQRRWHRIFGWGTINRHIPGHETILFDSEHKHIKHYVMGKGWIDYIGQGPNGIINTICMKLSELYEDEQKDRQQALMSNMVKVIK